MHSALPTSRKELFMQAVQVKASVQLKHGAEQFWHIPLCEYIWAGHYVTHWPWYWGVLFLHSMQEVLLEQLRHCGRHATH